MSLATGSNRLNITIQKFCDLAHRLDDVTLSQMAALPDPEMSFVELASSLNTTGAAITDTSAVQNGNRWWVSVLSFAKKLFL